jgi:hypothetical protein
MMQLKYDFDEKDNKFENNAQLDEWLYPSLCPIAKDFVLKHCSSTVQFTISPKNISSLLKSSRYPSYARKC